MCSYLYSISAHLTHNVQGWISVRQEYRKRMMLFLGLAVYMIAGWAVMFIAATFRWTYATWLFFSLMTTAAVLLALTTLILGIVCRLNFGKGLKRYCEWPLVSVAL